MSHLRAIIVLSLCAALVLILAPIQYGLLQTGHPPAARPLPKIFGRIVCWLLGIRIHVVGSLTPAKPLLLSCNHTSWLDIPILSALAPVSFTAKNEIKGWLGVSVLAKLQQTLFIERTKRTETAKQRDQMRARLARGDILVLFPEGTSSDGNRILPFKSALLSVAQEKMPHPDGGECLLTIQPMTLSYTRFRGLPMARHHRPWFAWYGAMQLPGHLWRVFGMSTLEVVAEFHAPVTIEQFADRKELARYCEQKTRAGLIRALRDTTPPSPAAKTTENKRKTT